MGVGNSLPRLDERLWIWPDHFFHFFFKLLNQDTPGGTNTSTQMTKLWNLLDLRIRQLPHFESFKYKLKQQYYKNVKPLSFYNIGNIYLTLLHKALFYCFSIGQKQYTWHSILYHID